MDFSHLFSPLLSLDIGWHSPVSVLPHGLFPGSSLSLISAFSSALSPDPGLLQKAQELLQRAQEMGGDGVHAIAQQVSASIHGVTLALQQTLNAIHQQLAVWGNAITGAIAITDLWRMGLYWLVVIMMIAGVVGSFVPALPGVALVLLAVVLWGAVTGFALIVWPLVVAIAAFILSIIVDNVAGLMGAQKAGASRWGQIGAIVGMAFGFFGLIPALPVGGPLIGIILGTVLGAFVGEFLYRRDLPLIPRAKQSLNVGLAIVVGNLVGNLLQGVLALITLVVFLSNTWGTLYG